MFIITWLFNLIGFQPKPKAVAKPIVAKKTIKKANNRLKKN